MGKARGRFRGAPSGSRAAWCCPISPIGAPTAPGSFPGTPGPGRARGMGGPAQRWGGWWVTPAPSPLVLSPPGLPRDAGADGGEPKVPVVGPALLGCWGELVSPRCPHAGGCLQPGGTSLLRSATGGELPPFPQGLANCRPVTVTGSGDGGSPCGSSALSPLPRRWQEPDPPLKCPNVPS